MKKMPVAIALSSLTLLLSSLSQAVHADNYIDAPGKITSANFENTGRTGLVAAGAETSIKNLAQLTDGRRVRLNGTVERMHGAHGFTLHDETGRIDVAVTSMPAHVKIGSEVAVAGRINRGLLGSNIEAQIVTLQHKANEQAETTKPAKVSNIPAYSVQTLPETGVVKISGIVTTSDNATQFVLKDATGLVDVTVEQGNASNVLKGAKVTVVGSVDRGVLGKDISANTIIVEKNAQMASAY